MTTTTTDPYDLTNVFAIFPVGMPDDDDDGTDDDAGDGSAGDNTDPGSSSSSSGDEGDEGDDGEDGSHEKDPAKLSKRVMELSAEAKNRRLENKALKERIKKLEAGGGGGDDSAAVQQLREENRDLKLRMAYDSQARSLNFRPDATDDVWAILHDEMVKVAVKDDGTVDAGKVATIVQAKAKDGWMVADGDEDAASGDDLPDTASLHGRKPVRRQAPNAKALASKFPALAGLRGVER